MAELGIAASGIGIASLAIQVGDNILKLKDFWDKIKEAPEEIKYILKEIEALSLVLSDLARNDDNGELPQIAPTSSMKCMELCRDGTNLLLGVVSDLDTEIGKKRRIGSVKAVLKKGTVERLRERLRSAQMMLMLSNQIYSQ